MRREGKEQREKGRSKEYELEDQLNGPPKKNPSPMMLTHHFNRHTQTWMWPTVQNMWRPEPEQRLTTRCGGIKTVCFLDANKSFLEACSLPTLWPEHPQARCFRW